MLLSIQKKNNLANLDLRSEYLVLREIHFTVGQQLTELLWLGEQIQTPSWLGVSLYSSLQWNVSMKLAPSVRFY